MIVKRIVIGGMSSLLIVSPSGIGIDLLNTVRRFENGCADAGSAVSIGASMAARSVRKPDSKSFDPGTRASLPGRARAPEIVASKSVSSNPAAWRSVVNAGGFWRWFASARSPLAVS